MTVAPTPYLRAARDLLRETEPELWEFFRSARTGGRQQADDVRRALLADAYRLEPDEHPELHAALASAAAALGTQEPVVLHQAAATPFDGTGNAHVVSLPDEVHVVFSGPLLELLGPRVLGVLGHELAHDRLQRIEDGDLAVAGRLLAAAAHDPDALPSHVQTARLFSLHLETAADRGALLATGDLPEAVSVLVTLLTGLKQVSGARYLAQAAELLGGERPESGADTHPEAYVRARALQLWAEAGQEDAQQVEAQVAELLRGTPRLDDLDLLEQRSLSALTLRLLGCALREPDLQTDAVLAHARTFDPSAGPAADPDPALAADLAGLAPELGRYGALVLLDLATVDPDLDGLGVDAVLRLSAELGTAGAVDAVLRRELKMTASAVTRRRRALAPAGAAPVRRGRTR